MYRSIFVFILINLLISSCRNDTISDLLPNENLPTGTTFISSSPQRTGNPQKGYEYLTTGDYVNSGVPLDFYLRFIGEDNNNLLNRTGDNAKLPYFLNAVQASNGVNVVGANCLTCHAETINGDLIIGLGNTTFDYTINRKEEGELAATTLELFYGKDSPERMAYESFRRGTDAISDKIVTEVRGINPAGKLAVVLGAHRNKETLEWEEQPIYPIPSEVIPSDVPPLWHTKKKNALSYTGIGQGDHARAIMAASILTLQNREEAQEIDTRFPDVLAYLKTLKAPTYPEAIDPTKSAKGLLLFERECAQCHGTYGVEETYPNLLVAISVIKTDPLLATANYGYDAFLSTYNQSWFGQEPNGAKLTNNNGYIAPPLDGIWATAPYLHNGSVPSLYDLLNSPQRPTYWERSYNTSDYDYEKLGWNYTRLTQGDNSTIYNTTLPGYNNTGHTYGDHLTEEERYDLIEYLKTL